MKQYKDLTPKEKQLFREIETLFFNERRFKDLNTINLVKVLGVLINKWKLKDERYIKIEVER